MVYLQVFFWQGVYWLSKKMKIFRILPGFFRPKINDLSGFSWVIYCDLQCFHSKFSFPSQDFFRVNFRTLKVQANDNMDYSKTSIFKTSTSLLAHIFWNSFSEYWRQNQSHSRAKWGSSRIFAMNLIWDLSQNKSHDRAKRGRSIRFFCSEFGP